jgi:hypothetical protein
MDILFNRNKVREPLGKFSTISAKGGTFSELYLKEWQLFCSSKMKTKNQ